MPLLSGEVMNIKVSEIHVHVASALLTLYFSPTVHLHVSNYIVQFVSLVSHTVYLLALQWEVTVMIYKYV